MLIYFAKIISDFCFIMQLNSPYLVAWSTWSTCAICFPIMPHCFSNDLSFLKLVQRVFTQTVYGHGARVRPKRPCIDWADFPSGSLKVKACIRLVNIRNSSILASCSPMHTRRPVAHRKYLFEHSQKLEIELKLVT